MTLMIKRPHRYTFLSIKDANRFEINALGRSLHNAILHFFFFRCQTLSRFFLQVKKAERDLATRLLHLPCTLIYLPCSRKWQQGPGCRLSLLEPSNGGYQSMSSSFQLFDLIELIAQNQLQFCIYIYNVMHVYSICNQQAFDTEFDVHIVSKHNITTFDITMYHFIFMQID